MIDRKINLIVVHCSATKPSMDIGSEEIDEWHRLKGFSMCGYHVVIRRDGTVETAGDGYKCRPFSKAGAHAKRHNDYSIGICVVGGISETELHRNRPIAEDNFTDEQKDSLELVLRHLLKLYPEADIFGHRDLPGVHKDCPSFEVSDFLADRGLK